MKKNKIEPVFDILIEPGFLLSLSSKDRRRERKARALRKGRMIRRLIPLHRKAFTLVQPQRIALFSAFSVLSNGTVSYKERLRSGLVGIKKEDAVDLFESMVRCRHPLPTLVDFSRLFSGIARTKQYDLVLHLCKKMELQGVTHNDYTLILTLLF